MLETEEESYIANL